MKNTYRILTIKYCILQGIYWSLVIPLMEFAVPLLESEGYSSIEISVINGMRFLAMAFFQYFLGEFLDRHRERIALKHVLMFLTVIGSIGTLILYFYSSNFFITLIIFIIFGMSYGCLIPMIESMSLAYMDKGMDLNYAYSRACGSLTYFLFSLFVGFVVNKTNEKSVLIFQFFFSAMMLISAFIMPDDRLEKKIDAAKNYETAKPHKAIELLSGNKKYRLYLISCFLVLAGYGLNYAFLIDKVYLVGGTAFTFGIVNAVISISEIPVEFSFDKIRQKFKLDNIILIFPVFCTLRALGTLIAPDSMCLIFVQLFEVFGMSIYYSASLYFVKENVSVKDQVKGMSLINMFATGMGEFVSNFSAGFFKEIFGLNGLMIISVLVSALAIVTMTMMHKAKKCDAL